MAEFIKVAKNSEIGEGQAKLVQCAGNEIALWKASGKCYAVGNVCPHLGGPISEGTLEGKVVTCPWHGWNYDLESGVSPINPNAYVPTYEVRVEGDEILISSEAKAPGE